MKHALPALPAAIALGVLAVLVPRSIAPERAPSPAPSFPTPAIRAAPPAGLDPPAPRAPGPGRSPGLSASRGSQGLDAALRGDAAEAVATLRDAVRFVSDSERRRREQRRGPRSPRHVALLRGAGVLRPSGRAVRIDDVEHVSYALTKQGLPVFNRRGRLHERAGALLGATGWTRLQQIAGGRRRVERPEALERAREAAGVRALRSPATADAGWLVVEDATLPVWRVRLPALDPLGSFEVMLDARSGEAVRVVDRLLHLTGTGTAYDPNPLAGAPVPVTLPALDGSGNLAGRYTKVFDLVAPAAFSPGLVFQFPEGDPRQVQTGVYWALSRTAEMAVSHGFPDFPAPVVAYTNLRNPDGSEYNNAFYDPFLPAFAFGNGDGAVLANLATDTDVPAHEMGHHVFEVLVEPEIGSLVDAVLAMHEGVADTFSMLLNDDPRIGESTVPGRPELRRLDQNWRYPDDAAIDPHDTGLIYGAANWRLRNALGQKRFLKALLRGLPFLPPDAQPEEYPDAFVRGLKKVVPRSKRDRFVTRARKIFDGRGFDEVAPRGFQGELVDGTPESRRLRDNKGHIYVYTTPPGAGTVRFATTGTGDVDLIVAAPDFDPDDPSTFRVSQGFTSNESITWSPSPADTFFLVGVFDFKDGRRSRYRLTADTTLAAPDFALGGEVSGRLDAPGEIDFATFTGLAGQVVRVEVESLEAGLDLIAGVFSTPEIELLDANDDGGPGADPLLQGVVLPEDGRYAVGVMDLFQDFDPSLTEKRVVAFGIQVLAFATPNYRIRISLCPNHLGPDSDGDGKADACDDDDDDDTFEDDADTAPLDPTRCEDVDVDGCDDCSSGVFDLFADGVDGDGDGQCDVGDLDDDNDGCADALDPAPDQASADVDFDFLGEDCDNCIHVANPLQEDADTDGLGDACASCAPVAWTDPPDAPPDQNPRNTALRLFWPRRPGKQGFRITGAFNPATDTPPLDPVAAGVHLRLEDVRGVLTDLNLPGGLVGSSPCDPGDGWTRQQGLAGTVWEYHNVSDAVGPGCLPGSAGGIESVRIEDLRAGGADAVTYRVETRGDTLPHTPTTDFLRFTLAFAPQLVPDVPSAAALAGQCVEMVTPGPSTSLECRKKKPRNDRLRRKWRIQHIDCEAP